MKIPLPKVVWPVSPMCGRCGLFLYIERWEPGLLRYKGCPRCDDPTVERTLLLPSGKDRR
jgi:hypothetical protein